MQSEDKSKGPINYGQKKYWDERYQKRSNQRYEWLEPYPRLKQQLQLCMPQGKHTRILNLGCGNGSLQEQLYQDGYHHIANIDISAIVIQQMSHSAKQKGYDMRFDVMDVRHLQYEGGSFDLIIDKSTIDSLMCSDNPLINVANMIEQGHRVLKQGGYFFTVSYNGGRMQHFTRELYNFDMSKKEMKKLDEHGMQIVNHVYIGRKLPMAVVSVQGREEFYRRLKDQEEREYPL